jgi:hypothetical protein
MFGIIDGISLVVILGALTLVVHNIRAELKVRP